MTEMTWNYYECQRCLAIIGEGWHDGARIPEEHKIRMHHHEDCAEPVQRILPKPEQDPESVAASVNENYRGRPVEGVEEPMLKTEEDDFIWLLWVEWMEIEDVSKILRRKLRSCNRKKHHLGSAGFARAGHLGLRRRIDNVLYYRR